MKVLARNEIFCYGRGGVEKLEGFYSCRIGGAKKRRDCRGFRIVVILIRLRIGHMVNIPATFSQCWLNEQVIKYSQYFSTLKSTVEILGWIHQHERSYKVDYCKQDSERFLLEKIQHLLLSKSPQTKT
uniref:Uncharacterized protein n=1 Tax=Glossina austeni TaxID=7395 RepID=A0A1A9VCD9_GLOAU